MIDLNDELTLDSAPMSETSALKNILTWSLDRPRWQRDALRRLIVNNGEIGQTDLDELYKICTDEKVDFSPLKSEHISPENVQGEPVSLLEISNPVGINALAKDQCLKLVPTGLTVVYGDNGSGKSGYVRILKNACRSRDSKLSILSNINSSEKINQSATIVLKKGTLEQKFEWSPYDENDPCLPSVSIFDSRSANTHLGGQHHVAYTPFPMEILHQLNGLCESLKEKLDSNIKALQTQSPMSVKNSKLNSETAAGAFLEKISSKTKITELNNLTEISESDKKRHESLQADLSGDPNKVVANLTSIKKRLSEHVKDLESYVDFTSESEIIKVSGLRKSASEKTAVAKIAADDLFKASPLPEIGGDRWKALWEAARDYSDFEANIEKKFPTVALDDDLCVLCQQPLDAAAVNRWSTFEEYIKGTTKANEQLATNDLNNALEVLSSKQVPASQLVNIRALVKNEMGDEQLARKLTDCAIVAYIRYRAIKQGKQPPTKQILFPVQDVSKALQAIDSRIIEINAAADADKRAALLLELAGFKDRLALSVIKADVIAEIDRMNQIDGLKVTVKTTAKAAVTNKNKELSDKLVTNTLRARFAREISKLDVSAMPIELKKIRDRNAQSYFKVVFVGKPDEPLGEILSEGEHRCVALAAFLAELVTSNDKSGIVFDDPMSSLDHLYRQKVAKRLVEEAEHRQVVIFTHDITFLFEVSREADVQQCDIAYQTIKRNSKGPGNIEEGLPFKAKLAGKMENDIRSYLKSIKGSFDNKTESERSVLATGVIAQIRKAWEQGVADFVRPVLARFDSHVKPGSLFKLLVLDESDVIEVQNARSRLSEDVHAGSETLNPAEVEHKNLVEELDKLQLWLNKVRDKQKTFTKPN